MLILLSAVEGLLPFCIFSYSQLLSSVLWMLCIQYFSCLKFRKLEHDSDLTVLHDGSVIDRLYLNDSSFQLQCIDNLNIIVINRNNEYSFFMAFLWIFKIIDKWLRKKMINENFILFLSCVLSFFQILFVATIPLGEFKNKTFSETLLSFRLRQKNVSKFSPSEVIGLGEISWFSSSIYLLS